MKSRPASCGCHSHNGFQLSPEGLAQKDAFAPLRTLGVDEHDDQLYLDKVDSVSALVEGEGACVWDEQVLDSQYRRFLDAVA